MSKLKPVDGSRETALPRSTPYGPSWLTVMLPPWPGARAAVFVMVVRRAGRNTGLLAAHCLQHNLEPHQVREDETRLKAFQALCVQQGFELEWPHTHAV